MALATVDGSVVRGHSRGFRYLWIFPRQRIEGGLDALMTFYRRRIDGVSSVYLRPHGDVDCAPA